MLERVTLKEGNEQNTYVLEAVLLSVDPCNGMYPCNIRAFPLGKDCWIVQLTQATEVDSIKRDIGVVKEKAKLSSEIYKCAVEAGRGYAGYLGCGFVDETQRGKLERIAQSSPKCTKDENLPDFATTEMGKVPNFLPDNEYPGIFQ